MNKGVALLEKDMRRKQPEPMVEGRRIQLNDLLLCAIQILGRSVMPLERVQEILGRNKKYLKAYNLCDGERTQREVAKLTRLHQRHLVPDLTELLSPSLSSVFYQTTIAEGFVSGTNECNKSCTMNFPRAADGKTAWR